MDYNTVRNTLVLSEYGRNVQRMVEYLLTIEDEKKRKEQMEAVTDIMAQLNPQIKMVDDWKQRLWDHLIMMSDFKLQVESPFPYPSKEVIYAKPERLPYPQSEFKHKHYGKNVETLIEKAEAMDDEAKKKDFAESIANYMKLVHANWSNETVNNEVIVADLTRMSGGKLELPEDFNLDQLARPTRSSGSSNYSNNRGRRKGGPGKGGKRSNYKRRKN